MHEHGLMTSLIRKVERVAADQAASAGGAAAVSSPRVTAVRLAVGTMSGIEAAHLAHHFREAARGTIVEGADLEMVPREGFDVFLESVDVEL